MKKLKIIFVLSLGYYLCFGICHSVFAQQDNKLAAFSKQIIEAKSNEELYVSFEVLKDFYFQDNKYAEFVDYLKSLGKKKKQIAPFINYYTALTRYVQLKYLEEIQDWNEYFSEGDQYRAELEKKAQQAIEATKANEAIHLYARFLLFRFHKDRQDGQNEQALADLVNSALEYAQGTKDIAPIRDIADQLSAYGEKSSAHKLYTLYVEKLATTEIKNEELAKIARDFYEQQNLELSQIIYDTYISRIEKTASADELASLLYRIAQDFAYQDGRASDPAYAEKLFQKIEAIKGKDGFLEEQMYLRAFNLEKMHAFGQAKEIYADLLKKFPAAKYQEEIIFKIALIQAYVLHEPQGAAVNFSELAKKANTTAWTVSSLYQLGLFNQWQGDLEKAKGDYEKLIALAKGDFADTTELAQARLAEIQAKAPLEYNLKTFLDLALKGDNLKFQQAPLDLSATPYRAKKDSDVLVDSNIALPESGCTQVELHYLWSGDLGAAKPQGSENSFLTNYQWSGTKIIQLVVVDPSGTLNYGIDLLDSH